MSVHMSQKQITHLASKIPSFLLGSAMLGHIRASIMDFEMARDHVLPAGRISAQFTLVRLLA
jgi:hypothetical protein